MPPSEWVLEVCIHVQVSEEPFSFGESQFPLYVALCC